MKVFPVNRQFSPNNAPWLSYRFFINNPGDYHLTVTIAPSNNYENGKGLQFAVRLDNGDPILIDTLPEGFAAGELKHGPFALLTKETPVVAIATNDFTYNKIIANIGEVKARGPTVVAIVDEDDTETEKHADYILRIPSNSDILSCIPIIVTLQLLAYHVANLRGCSIDKPRNLAKSVTVE